MSVVGDVLNFGLGLANAGYTIYNDQRMIDTQNRWRTEDQAREDSVLQRSRVDAEKAGFSPLAALSNPVGSSASPVPVGSSDSPFSSAQSALSTAANNKLAREQALMNKQLTESQIANTDADTRDKNASADVNEATTAVQVLKAKAELDAMIQNNNITEAQIVKYLNDMKSEGISDTVIDSLLAQFGATPNTPTISSADLSGNKLLNKEYDKIVQDIAESKQNVEASKAAAAYHASLKNMTDAEFNAATKSSAGAQDQRIVNQIQLLEKQSNQNWTTVTLPATTIAGRTVPAISISNPGELEYAAQLYAALAMVEANANEANYQSLVRDHPILGAIMRVLGKDNAAGIFGTITNMFRK